MPVAPTNRSRSDSWPPTQVHLNPGLDLEDGGMKQTDVNNLPLQYYLNPPSPFDIDPHAAGYDFGPRADLMEIPLPRITVTNPSLEDLPWGDQEPESDGEDVVRYPLDFDVQYHRREPVYSTFRTKPRSKKSKKVSRAAGVHSRGRMPQREVASQGGSAGRRARREPSPYVWRIDEESSEDCAGHYGDVAHVSKEERGRSHSKTLSMVSVGEVELDEAKVTAKLKNRKVRFAMPLITDGAYV